MRYNGRVIFEGYAIADVLVVKENSNTYKKSFQKGPEEEFARFAYARNEAIKSFDELYETTLKTLGEEKANLFQTYRLMADDPDFEDLVRSSIYDGESAENAITNACKQLSDSFAILEDEYMRQRALDVIEVGKNLVDVLLGNNQTVTLTKPTILVCNDLAASVLMKLNRKYLKGLVLINGNENSHVAIFARTLELPTICGLNNLNLTSIYNDKVAIIDASKGSFVIEPTSSEIKEYQLLEQDYLNEGGLLKTFIGKPTTTKDGVKLKIYANIASALEIENVKKNDSEGIGLFRSEFIYLASTSYPREDFQFNYYREVLEEMKDKEVIIRTMDIGADKSVPYFNLGKETNPALGLRSIRVCRKQPKVFYTQLRALYRASIYGNLSIMIPMIISVDEINFFKDMIKQVKEDLKKEKIPFNDKVKVGIMIETPAAAIISDELAKHVDFFSIGTNDLSQYTLACDRLNPALDDTFDKKHSAIMRLIKMTVDNAHKAGVTCGICGELGRDPEMLPFFAAIHIDEISCSSAYVLKTRKALAEIDTREVDIDKYLDLK